MILAVAASAALATATWWHRQHRRGPLPPIVLIVVDTLRADHLGCYGYARDTSPHIDALARDALLFENAMTPSGTTMPAHVSLFSSTNPLRHGIRGNLRRLHASLRTGDQFVMMAQILSRLGYRTAAFVSSQAVSSYSGLAAGFDVYDEGHGNSLQRDAGQTLAEVVKWIDAADASQPFFLFVHFIDPHDPYYPPEQFRWMFRADEAQREQLRRRGVEPDDATLEAVNYYDGEIRYVDETIGSLLAKLGQKGITERAAIVFAADHGEGLGQHGWMRHGRVYREQMHVPLVLRLPDRRELRGRRFAGPVSLIDVLPTLAANLDLPLLPREAEQFEGTDVLSAGPRKYVYAERAARPKVDQRVPQDPDPAETFVLAGDEWTYFYRPESGDDKLFRVDRDPDELHDVIAENPAEARELRAALVDQVEAYRRHGNLAHPEDGALPPEVVDRLHQLGYDL